GAPVVIPEFFENCIRLAGRHSNRNLDRLLLAGNSSVSRLREERTFLAFDDDIGGNAARIGPVALKSESNKPRLRFIDDELGVASHKLINAPFEKRRRRVCDS